MTDLIIRFAVLFVGLALAAFVIARMTQGIIRWVILAAVGALAVVAISMGLKQFAAYIPGIASRPNASIPAQPNTVPSSGTASPANVQPNIQPSASATTSPSPQATVEPSDVQTGATGLNRLPAFAQSFDTQGNRTANGQSNNSTNNAGDGNPNGTDARPQTSTPSRPIPAGW